MNILDKIDAALRAVRLHGEDPEEILLPAHMKDSFKKAGKERFGPLKPRTDGGNDYRYVGLPVRFTDVENITIAGSRPL